MVEPGALVDFEVQAHKLLLHDVERLLPAQIRVLLPPPHDAFGEDVFCRLHVLGCSHLENWMIGVDAPTLF